MHRTAVNLQVAASRLNLLRRVPPQGAGAQFQLQKALGRGDQTGVVLESRGNLLKAGKLLRQQAESQLNLHKFAAPVGDLIKEILCD